MLSWPQPPRPDALRRPPIGAASRSWSSSTSRLVVLDSLADVYAGNEIVRSEARQFIGLLRGLAIRNGLTVVLLSHPSVAGIQSGSGTSGSTAWSNSVRSRLALERIKNDQGKEIEPDRRLLKIMRSNYGPADKVMRLSWVTGVWELDGPNAEGGFDQAVAEARRETVFTDLLADLVGQGRDLSPNRSPSFAPAVFAKHPSAQGFTKDAFEKAMEGLLSAGRIRVETCGSPSRQYKRLVFTARKEDA
jgi:RecA-family ATPase